MKLLHIDSSPLDGASVSRKRARSTIHKGNPAPARSQGDVAPDPDQKGEPGSKV